MLRHRITEEHEQLEAEKTREVASVTTRMLTQQERDVCGVCPRIITDTCGVVAGTGAAASSRRR